MERINLYVVFYRTEKYYDNPLQLPDEPKINVDTKISPKLAEWEEYYKISWWEFRQRLAEITFLDVDKWRVDGIINWFDRKLLDSLHTLPGKNFIIQIDDDDWLHPQLFIDLKAALRKQWYSTACWNSVLISPDDKRRLTFVDCTKVMKDEQESGVFFGGTYGFDAILKPSHLLGQHKFPTFNFIKKENKEERALTLTKQPYMFRNLNPAGRGFLGQTRSIEHSLRLAKNHKLFLAKFDGATIGFEKQIKAYKQLLDTTIK